MITKKLLRDWGACWSDGRIDRYFGERTALTPREIAADESISSDDRLWVLTQALAHRNEDAARTFAIDCAASVSHLAGRPEDQAAHARLIEELRSVYRLPQHERTVALQKWAAAVVHARLAAVVHARLAAWDAARDAAADAAWYAAMDAAAADAAWYAARAAAADAAWYAAMDAARAAAIQRVLVSLGSDADGWTE